MGVIRWTDNSNLLSQSQETRFLLQYNSLENIYTSLLSSVISFVSLCVRVKE